MTAPALNATVTGSIKLASIAAGAPAKELSMSNQAESAKLSYTIPEAVKATGISRTRLYAEMSAGRLRAKKRGSTTIILADALREYLAALPDMESKQ